MSNGGPDDRARLAAFARRWWSGELGLPGAVLSTALAPAEAAYRGVIAARNAAYERGVLGIERADITVISVGNIAVGGTGKTPFAHWLAVQLSARGERPAVLHGGYAADEPELHRRWSPDIPVIVDRDRVRGVRRAQQAGATVAVLDDAFQHRRLQRDLDIVLIAAERWSPSPDLLPRGPWRESPAALQRADIIVCTRKTASAEHAAAAAAEMASVSGRPVMRAHLRAAGWRRDGRAAQPPEGPALLVAALAEPDAFEHDARAAGGEIADTMIFPDHHVYDDADAERIRRLAAGRIVISTEKDWTKLDRHLSGDRVWLLTQEVMIETGAELLESALTRILS